MAPKFFTLSNGLRVVLIDTKAFPTLTTIILFGAGSRYETEKNNGIAHFFEHILFKGSKKYPSALAISSLLEGMGAVNNAFTSKEVTGYFVKGTVRHFAKILDVLADMIISPLLKPEEIEREKGVIAEEINMYEDNPARKVADVFENLLYTGNPLGFDTTGTKETVRGFSRQTFLDYMRRLYSPKNAVLVVAGGLELRSQENLLISELASRHSSGPVAPRSSSESEGSLRRSFAQTSTYRANFLSNSRTVDNRARGSPSSSTPADFGNWSTNYLKIIEGKFGRWDGLTHSRGGKFEGVREKQKRSEILVKNKKTQQTHFSLGFRTFSRFDKRKYTLSVLSTILGGGMSSRLFIEVRERRGLCYYISTQKEAYLDVGYMTTQAGVTNDKDKIKQAIGVILDEHKKVAEGRVSDEEVRRAKEMIRGRTLMSFEDSANVASWYGTKLLLEGKMETVEEVLGKIEKVKKDEIIEVAKNIIRPERLNLAMIGPFDKKDFRGLII